MASRVNSNSTKAKGGLKYLVSACLAGIDCAYDGSNRVDLNVKRLVSRALALPVCPEVLGGATIPRARSEISAGDGSDVLDGRARVKTESGYDVTQILIRGANRALQIATEHGIKTAILKSKSPSCGSGLIHNGNFRGELRKGDGVACAILRRNGFAILTENDTYEE